jgi:hypothetical protein
MDFYLSGLKTEEDLLEITCRRWGFEYSNLPAPFSVENTALIKGEAVGNYHQFFIFYFVLDSSKANQKVEKFLSSQEREILVLISENYRRESLFIFSSEDGEYWHFVNPEKVGNRIKLKRFSITPENRNKLRTACEQLDNFKINPQKDTTTESIIRKKETAFNTEEVTDRFFEEYRKLFDLVKTRLIAQSKNSAETENKAHRYTHQLLNRLMFLYFVQKRGAFGKDKEFLCHFWNAYRDNFEDKNQFHHNWLDVLFFESLNHKFHSRDYFRPGKPYPDFNLILSQAPFLNGGLFKEDPELDFLGYQIEDAYFVKIFEFLESYNFTIEENTPFDQEIAINPEMLGYIYEMLVNISENSDERRQSGIFYTPKTEVELMIRTSLLEYLFNKTKIDKGYLYEFIFAEKQWQKTPQFSQDEKQKLLKELNEITILDPACGSGHFLVVALDIVFELKEAIYQQMGKIYDRFEEKKKIIEKSIFGVDAKTWAVEIAKLRLWLDLFLEAKEAQLKNSSEALLPSFSFKLRVGDSLVQSIGELMPLRKFKAPDKNISRKITQLTDHKVAVYQNRYDSRKAIEEERNLFCEILSYKKIKLKQEMQNLEIEIQKLIGQVDEINKKPLEGEFFTFGIETKDPGALLKKKQQVWEEKKKELSELERFLEYFQKLIQENAEPPLIWDIGFAEIFSEKDGFDILIANPPYVRQELISNPAKTENQPDKERREYKGNLLKQIQFDWDDKDGGFIKLSKRCDLYIYFYLKSLKLLNPDGIMCFISSNSWLDVEYGSDLQKILLKRVPILAIYDNQAKRSFKHADVNTIIILLKAPLQKDWQNGLKENLIKFVVFKKSFEEIMFTETFLEIENIRERTDREDFKVFPITQIDLWKDGVEIPENKDVLKFDVEHSIYIGNKWGGRYLRAPEIYWKILEKGKGKWVRLGDIAEVRRGFTTGANEFFYLEPTGKPAPKGLIHMKNGAGWEGFIEEEFLKPVIKSPRECKSILVKPGDLKYKVLMCHKTRDELKGTKVLEYIEWGQKQGYHKRPTCASREKWWDLGEREGVPILVSAKIGERYIVYLNTNGILEDKILYGVIPKNEKHVKYISLALNSCVSRLTMELLSRQLTGAQAIADVDVNVWKNVLLLKTELINMSKTDDSIFLREIRSVFVELGINPNKSIRSQQPNPLPDRKALDDIVFDILGLTEEERKEVYWAVCELVKNRLEKARSV